MEETGSEVELNANGAIQHVLCVVLGLGMCLGNLLLIFVILRHAKLRRRELLVVAGLALADMIYGMGNVLAGLYRLYLVLRKEDKLLVSFWDCIKCPQTFCFFLGSQTAALMLVFVSLDRLIAVRWFVYYRTLTIRYAVLVVGGVFGYALATVPLLVVGAYFQNGPDDFIHAACFSIGPRWYWRYQPLLQMSCGWLSVLIFALMLYFYFTHHRRKIKQRSTTSLSGRVLNQQRKNLRKINQIIGITVAFTFFTYIVPHSAIFLAQAGGSKTSQTWIIKYGGYGFVLSNVNSVVNIFIFGIMHPEIREKLRHMFSCHKESENAVGNPENPGRAK